LLPVLVAFAAALLSAVVSAALVAVSMEEDEPEF